MKIDRNFILTHKKVLFFPIVFIGIFLFILIGNLRPSADVKPLDDRSKIVNTMVLEKKKIAPQVIGFGKVNPKLEWEAIAEVTGKVIYRHPKLNKGSLLEKGTEVLRIDPLDYELILAQAEADLNSSKTQLAQIDLEEKNIRNTLRIETNSLAISKKELERKRKLQNKGLISRSELDQQNQSYLAQQKIVQEINNEIVLLPDERKVAEALVRVNQSKLDQAKRDLEKTVITLPADVRISDISVETDQVVNLQQSMFTAHGIDTMEVEAQVSIHDMQIFNQNFVVFESVSSVLDGFSLSATIELTSGRFKATWPARVVRFSETVDPTQATVGVILEIEQDYRDLAQQSVPALVNDMFVKAVIEGESSLHWVIPERALHGDKIYLLTDDNRLRILSVDVLFRRDNQVVISGDIHSGMKLILNDVLPAIEGMTLRDLDAMKEKAKEKEIKEQPVDNAVDDQSENTTAESIIKESTQ